MAKFQYPQEFSELRDQFEKVKEKQSAKKSLAQIFLDILNKFTDIQILLEQIKEADEEFQIINSEGELETKAIKQVPQIIAEKIGLENGTKYDKEKVQIFINEEFKKFCENFRQAGESNAKMEYLQFVLEKCFSILTNIDLDYSLREELIYNLKDIGDGHGIKLSEEVIIKLAGGVLEYDPADW